MQLEAIEKLRQQYTDQYVLADAAQPELARFAGIPGQVKTVNMSGRALVQFEGPDQGWHDIAVEFLKITDKPVPPPVKEAPAKEAPAKKVPAAKKPAGEATGG